MTSSVGLKDGLSVAKALSTARRSHTMNLRRSVKVVLLTALIYDWQAS